ncbi:PREDICTED: ribonuclease-like [Thamnophis sirtalis]|uniref:Ribonuclease-like n=1 Tax=Thamnophis sirtalis TaxID=35019 RepID=A0A6I9YI16_9SAUR|nr:PREDICTED: ribonuclease-like [Thamnophis sirtalis]
MLAEPQPAQRGPCTDAHTENDARLARNIKYFPYWQKTERCISELDISMTVTKSRYSCIFSLSSVAELIMCFKGFGLGLFVVLAAVLILGTFAATYQEFLEHHYDNPRSNVRGNYCNGMMRRRGITRPRCRPFNTFIHDTKKKIAAVCGNEGTFIPPVQPNNRGLWRSHQHFRVTTCKLRGSRVNPPCEYRINTSSRNIVLGCEGGQPVHYEEDEIIV